MRGGEGLKIWGKRESRKDLRRGGGLKDIGRGRLG